MGGAIMTDTARSAGPRVLFYVQHLLGIGHLARASRVTEALAADGFRVTVVTGGVSVEGFPAPGVDHVALPAVATADEGFGGLVDANGRAVDAAFEARRRDMLLALLAEMRPDIVMIEAFPFGRRQFRFELLPLIAAIEAQSPRPLVVTSLRDILQERAKPGRDEETVALVRAHFDRVFVHGDPMLARLDQTFPLAAQIADRIVYTGLVAPAPVEPSADRYDVVVSAGGGAVGVGLNRAVVQAAAALPDTGRWCLITGPNLPTGEADDLRSIAPPHVEVVRFRRDFPALLTAARLSVSQAGYNTVCDLLQARCRAILVPFATGGETEQTFRAARLEALGVARVLPEAELSGPRLAREIALSLSAPRPAAVMVALDGARRTAELLRANLREHLAAH
jgi:predicted glycosyltransferase